MQPADQQPMSVQPLVASNAVDAQQIIAAQDRVMQQQEGQLDSISRSLGTVKNMGLQIRDELDMQNHLLDDIEGGIDRTHRDMRGAQSRMDSLLKRTKDCKWICAIVVLAAIAIGLLGWVFRAK